jgi:succinate dehydrogenase / fumarate reductase flavoprotein subunit
MYARITGDDPYNTPMRIYPASHYTMGGLWVDYNLMSTIPGMHVIGEANFSDHGANRLGASALMQGLADGYFVLPYTIGSYFATAKLDRTVDTNHPEFKKAETEASSRINTLLSIKGKRTPTSFHRELGKVIWDKSGMGRNEKGLKEALTAIPQIREEFWKNLNVTGESGDLNMALEKALRVADFLEFAEVMVWDALERDESCGAHFREEHQTDDGEALRNDKDFAHVAAWEYTGVGNKPVRHVEPLDFENVHLSVRSYK